MNSPAAVRISPRTGSRLAEGARPCATKVQHPPDRCTGRHRRRLSSVNGRVNYLPAGRATFGHPVLSMHQTDIIYYGMNLVDYVYQEFSAGPGIDRADPRWLPRATVPFWRDFLE